jgi:hypothetical protein
LKASWGEAYAASGQERYITTSTEHGFLPQNYSLRLPWKWGEEVERLEDSDYLLSSASCHSLQPNDNKMKNHES